MGASAAALFALTIGCSNRLETYPASGKVLFTDGGPVHVGTVELKSREHGVQARGSIQSDGSFVLSTFTDGDGAVAGMHDCVVVQFVVAEGLNGHRPSTIGVVAPRFGSYSTSGLTVEISPSKPNELQLEVEGVLKQQPEEHSH